jgi:hypothetical protein
MLCMFRGKLALSLSWEAFAGPNSLCGAGFVLVNQAPGCMGLHNLFGEWKFQLTDSHPSPQIQTAMLVSPVWELLKTESFVFCYSLQI